MTASPKPLSGRSRFSAGIVQARRGRPLALAGSLGLLAVFFGLVSVMLPAWFIFAVLLVPALAALMLVRPEYALLACAALVCGLIHPGLVPRLPVFGGALAAADALLMLLCLHALWALATQDRPATRPAVVGARWMGVCMALFGLCFVIAVTSSLAVRDIDSSHVLGETRDLLYLLLLPVALVILRPTPRLKRFVIGLVVLGCLFSLGQVLQGVFKIPVFGDQGISVLETLGREESSTTRANTLGLNFIIFALLLTVGAYVSGVIRKPLFLAAGGLLLVGIVLTFGRTTFAAVLICSALVVWWLNPRRIPQMAVLLIAAVGLGSAAAAFFKPESFAAVYFRLTSIGEEINYGYSAQWRFWEAQAMLPHILEHPLIGVGLGADYKGASGSTVRPDLNRYVHNAYLYMAGKMGLPALLFFLLFMGSVFAVGRRSARSHALPWSRIVGAACAAMMIRFGLASVTEPHLMSDYGVVAIAIAGALVLLSAQREAPVAGPKEAAAVPSGAPGRSARWRGARKPPAWARKGSA